MVCGSPAGRQYQREGVKTPRSRCKPAVCLYDGFVYLHGGRDGYVPLKDLWRLELATWHWECICTTGEQPSYLQEHTMIAHQNRLYIFGGNFQFGADIQTPLWILDINDLVYKRYIPLNAKQICPGGRRGHTAVEYKGDMYIFGGYIDMKGSTGELWKLNFESQCWSLIENICDSDWSASLGRHGHTAVIHRRYMWVYGGLSDLQTRDDLCYFNFGLHQWYRVRCKYGPPSLEGHSACITQDTMYIYGGSHDGNLQNELWAFDIDFLTWSKVLDDRSSLQPPLAQHCAIAVPRYATSPTDCLPRRSSAPHRKIQQKANSSFSSLPRRLRAVSHLEIDSTTAAKEITISSHRIERTRSHPHLEAFGLSELRAQEKSTEHSSTFSLPPTNNGIHERYSKVEVPVPWCITQLSQTDSLGSVFSSNDTRPLLKTLCCITKVRDSIMDHDNPMYMQEESISDCKLDADISPNFLSFSGPSTNVCNDDLELVHVDDNCNVEHSIEIIHSRNMDSADDSKKVASVSSKNKVVPLGFQEVIASMNTISVSEWADRPSDLHLNGRTLQNSEKWIEMKDFNTRSHETTQSSQQSDKPTIDEDCDHVSDSSLNQCVVTCGMVNESFCRESSVENISTVVGAQAGVQISSEQTSLNEYCLHVVREAWIDNGVQSDLLEVGLAPDITTEIVATEEGEEALEEDFQCNERVIEKERGGDIGGGGRRSQTGYTMYIFGGRHINEAPNMLIQPLSVLALFVDPSLAAQRAGYEGREARPMRTESNVATYLENIKAWT